MIAHQAEGVNLPVGLRATLAQGFEEAPPVRVIPEDGSPPVSAIQDAVNRPFVFCPFTTTGIGAKPILPELRSAKKCNFPSSFPTVLATGLMEKGRDTSDAPQSRISMRSSSA